MTRRPKRGTDAVEYGTSFVNGHNLGVARKNADGSIEQGPHVGPVPGERWRLAKGGTETRTVRDRKLGGDVCYVTGRPPRNMWDMRHAYVMGERRCTLAEWRAWIAKGAKRLPGAFD